jgi:peptidoglycan/LPS O-acetylase OafA/YrhL
MYSVKTARNVDASTPLTFMPQLDGVRALAVLGVLVHHLLDQDLIPAFFSYASFGHVGVRLFFVLSGFLITIILLRSRVKKSGTGASRFWEVRQFYIRRFLRIFPLYYFVILCGAVINISPIREQLWWLATYLFNFKVASLGWFPDAISHFWSLAVEEQFYMVWPWLILFSPRRALLPLSLLVVIIGPISRAWMLVFGVSGPALFVVTPSCLDALGSGAAMAIACGGGHIKEKLVSRLTWFALPTGLVLIVVLELVARASHWAYAGHVHVVLYDTALALVFCWLVASASFGFSGKTGRFLSFAPIAYLGRIAYGIYVYHLLLAAPIFELGRAIGLSWEWKGYGYFVASSLTTVAVASLSWHLFEKPLNDLKRRFPY